MSEYDDALCAARALLIRDLVAARLLRPVTVAAPAVGTDWAATVPAGAVWDVLSVRASLVTSGTVANRMPELIYDDGTTTTVIASYGSIANETAGSTFTWQWHAGLGVNYSGTLGVSIAQASVLFTMPAGSRVRASTLSMQAGDQWGSIVVYVREWSEVRIVDASRYAAQTVAEQSDQRAWTGSPAG